jgi:1,4-alpha-glucan branching enzyme
LYYFIIVKVSTSTIKGHFLLVLHAHLPFIRYPEHDYHLEENWLYEAITETYIPLLRIFDNLLNDKVDFRITLSLTPTLVEMFNDSLLRERCQRYIDNLVELSEKEIARTRGDIGFEPVARMYHKKILDIQHSYNDIYRKDLTTAFGALLNSGRIEIITSSATHAYLPALMTEPTAVKAQIRLAAEHFRNTFGKNSTGIWLPECGFMPGIDQFIKDAGFNFFFLEGHSLLSGNPQSRYSIYAPVNTPSGAVVFARDIESSKQVWSSKEGYPGDYNYRDFYRDIGFDLDFDYIKPYLPGGTRTFTGIKYFRITDKSDNKKPYISEQAIDRAELHAEHFLKSRTKQIMSIHDKLLFRPVVTATYDAELFGHWWYEGPEWLNFVLRKGSETGAPFRFVTPTEYISENPVDQTVKPSMSSWGYKGYSSTWVDASNSWIYRHLHRAAKLMIETSSSNINAKGLLERTLNQVARELLLAQASDWPFMMKTGNAGNFAKNKFKEHIGNFFSLHRGIVSKSINETDLSVLEKKNNIFPDLDFRLYIKRQ